MAKILIVDDEHKMREILNIMLTLKGYDVEMASDGDMALELIKKKNYDVMISDINMPKLRGDDLLKKINELGLTIPVIFITAYSSVDSAVEAMKNGAIDYITKPFEEDRILLTIEKALSFSKIIEENKELHKQLFLSQMPKQVVCYSDKMKKVVDMCKKVALMPDTTVLIFGESGVGKEVISRFIHNLSPRRDNKFLAVNCAAIPETLIISELFGHEKNSFTGAESQRKGIFEAANNGTVFLDEIGDLAFEAQAKLLRFLQEKTISRIGSSEEIQLNTRVLAATNKDLKKMVEEKTFREDLYYRLNVFPIHIPPLRERKEDILPLSISFLKKVLNLDNIVNPFTEEALNILLEYDYPGNVRELGNIVERAVILAGGELPVDKEHLDFILSSSDKNLCFDFTLPEDGINLEDVEKELIKQALERCNNNKSAAAKLLGLTRSKFRTRIKMLEKEDEE
jgi:DNA-binding NtrC family response regulator